MYIGYGVFWVAFVMFVALICCLAVEVARRMDAESAADRAYRELDAETRRTDKELARRAFEAGLREQFERECA